MSKYKIQRWDVVMFNNSNSKVPMIYVKPDTTFIEFIRANNYAVLCEISGTGTIYDGKQIPAVVNTSMYVPNCRPNFYEKTGWYVITLWANWYGYPCPETLGDVKFYGMKDATTDDDSMENINNSLQDTETMKSVSNNTTGKNNVRLEPQHIALILIGIILLLTILTWSIRG